MLEWSTRWSTRSAKRVIAISEATKRDLVNHLKLAPDKIDVVYHGISNRLKPAIATETDRIRQRYDLPKRYILTIGTVQPRKNYGRLAAATAILQNQDKEMSLVVAGKRGWMAEQVEQDIFKSGADVRMIDYVDDGDLSALYSGALVYCQPSLYEGFGLPVLEAMACGTPVVAANNSSLPEIGGAAAVYVDETDPTEIARVLMNVLENASLCAELRARGLARAAGFTWEQTARATLDVFRHALSN